LVSTETDFFISTISDYDKNGYKDPEDYSSDYEKRAINIAHLMKDQDCSFQMGKTGMSHNIDSTIGTCPVKLRGKVVESKTDKKNFGGQIEFLLSTADAIFKNYFDVVNYEFTGNFKVSYTNVVEKPLSDFEIELQKKYGTTDSDYQRDSLDANSDEARRVDFKGSVLSQKYGKVNFGEIVDKQLHHVKSVESGKIVEGSYLVFADFIIELKHTISEDGTDADKFQNYYINGNEVSPAKYEAMNIKTKAIFGPVHL